MKKGIKKVFSILLVFVVFAGIFSGCGLFEEPGDLQDFDLQIKYPELELEKAGSVVEVKELIANSEGCEIVDANLVVDLESGVIDGYSSSKSLLEYTLEEIEDIDAVEGFVEYYSQFYVVTSEDGVFYVENLLTDEVAKMTFESFCDSAVRFNTPAVQVVPTGGFGLE